MFLYGMLYIILGIWALTSPYSLWLIGESWRSKNAEGPSDFYMKSTRVVGGFLLFIGVIGIIGLFT